MTLPCAKPRTTAAFGVLLLLISSTAIGADLKPHPLFTDGAVLQQGKILPVWGTAKPGETVLVRLGEHQASTKAGDDGRWKAELPAMKAGGPHELSIKCEDDSVTIKDVLIGEVWICSGQSNMQWPLSASEQSAEAIANSANPMIRLFTVPRRGASAPETTVEAAWQPCEPKTAAGFSAVGYFFGKDLQKALNVPIGLIGTNYGGTAAEEWTSREKLLDVPELREMGERRPNEAQAKAKVDEKVKAKAKSGGNSLRGPTVLYNAMIHPLLPYAIRGAIWYQGESNAGKAYQYRTLFPAMIKDWRERFGQGDFPFLFVQLAPFNARSGTWPELREAQLLTTQILPNAAMAVITDAGDAKDIHPKRKQPVGARLALAALAMTYGKEIVSSGPIYDSMSIDGDKAVLRFKSIGGGLEVRDDLERISEANPMAGFTIAGEDKQFVPAKVLVVGDSLVVSSAKVARPVAVRYGWADVPAPMLWNKDGLPATPFRTDDFPGITQPKK